MSVSTSVLDGGQQRPFLVEEVDQLLGRPALVLVPLQHVADGLRQKLMLTLDRREPEILKVLYVRAVIGEAALSQGAQGDPQRVHVDLCGLRVAGPFGM